MNFRKILQNALVETADSPINGKIEVVRDKDDKNVLLVNGVIQSGGRMEEIWRQAFEEITNYEFSNCLILGLGAGSAAKLISGKWPKAKIIGIEIDSKIVELGKKYFGLGKIKNLEIVTADAISVINHEPYMICKYDLVIVDLFIGAEVPYGEEKEEFLKSVKNILSDKGIAILNRFYTPEEQQRTDYFRKKLENHFRKTEERNILKNKLFFCQA